MWKAGPGKKVSLISPSAVCMHVGRCLVEPRPEISIKIHQVRGRRGRRNWDKVYLFGGARSKQHFSYVPTVGKSASSRPPDFATPSAVMSLAQGDSTTHPRCSTPPPKTRKEPPAVNSSPLAGFNDHIIATPPKCAKKPVELAVVGIKGKHGVEKCKRCVGHGAMALWFSGRRLL